MWKLGVLSRMRIVCLCLEWLCLNEWVDWWWVRRIGVLSWWDVCFKYGFFYLRLVDIFVFIILWGFWIGVKIMVMFFDGLVKLNS